MTDELNAVLFKAAQKFTGEERDDQFTSWTMEITDVYPKSETGYVFAGKLVSGGAVERKAKPVLYLVMTQNGPQGHQTATYCVVQMNPDGAIINTGISTDDKSKGWGLRIRDRVDALLVRIAKPSYSSNTQWADEVDDISTQLGELQADLDAVMHEVGGNIENHYFTYGRYGFDQLLGVGNPYDYSLCKLANAIMDDEIS